jgi:ABC-type nitrate/sulfonate/bicarbonate transport system substrate-binding protein
LPSTSKLILLTTLAALPLLLIAATACAQTEPESVVFMNGYKAQANLPVVSVYIAQEKGFFTEQGLEVEIHHATSGEHVQLLMAGDVDFATADAASVLKRRADPGLPIVAFALFGQRGQQGFLALKDSGITTPNDWEGRTFGYKVSIPPDYLAIVDAAQVDRSTVQEVRVGFDPRVLTEGQVDVLAVFKSNEPNTIRRMGFDVTLWDPADFGVPTMGLTYITREELANSESDKVGRFLKATMKALEYAQNNRDEAIQIVMKYAPEEDPAHQRFMLDTEFEDAVSLLTDQRGLGQMSPEQWHALYDHLTAHEALPKPFDYNDAFDTQFLDSIYDGNTLQWP